MTKNLDDVVPKIARNELFYFIARVCMIAASLIGVPFAGFIGARIGTMRKRTDARNGSKAPLTERPVLAQSGRSYANGISWSITNE
jgi:hypothetical protein